MARPEKDWIRVENAHEPLVDKDTFYTVLKRVRVKRPQNKLNSGNILRGLVLCGECGSSMVYKKENSVAGTAKYQCNLYVHRDKGSCTIHSITADDLKAIVLEDINRHITLSKEDKAAYIEQLINRSDSELNGEKASYQKELQKIKQRLDELNVILQNLPIEGWHGGFLMKSMVIVADVR